MTSEYNGKAKEAWDRNYHSKFKIARALLDGRDAPPETYRSCMHLRSEAEEIDTDWRKYRPFVPAD